MADASDLAKGVIDWGFDRWHSRSGLAAVLVGILLVGVVTFAGIDIRNVSIPEAAILAFVLGAVTLIWFRTRIERADRKKVGFGVAIECEDAETAKQLRSDFLVTLRNLLDGSHHRHQFQFISFPQSLAKRVTSEEQARWLLKKANLKFLIHGRARLGKTALGQTEVLDLSWMVRHGQISAEESAAFRSEAQSVVPGRYIFPGGGDMFTLEFAAQYVDIAARFVIGTAAAMSGDFVYAEQLLLDAETKLNARVKHAEGTPVSVLLDRIRRRLEDLYRSRIGWLTQEYRARRDRALLEEAEAVGLRLRARSPDEYPLRLLSSMAAFMLRRDLPSARQQIDACRGIEDGTWRFGEAFLLAYEGDLEAAYRAYRQAFESPVGDPNVAVECEDFIQIVLDEEPEKTWLYYCLGLLNHRGKGDLEAARADFRRFVETADPVRFKRHIEIAERWIGEIDAILSAPASGARR